MDDLFFGTRGPRDARLLLVGESWGAEEEAQKLPFVGSSGKLLDSILAEAGIDPSSVLMTNVVSERPLANEMWRFFWKAKEAPEPAVRGLHPRANVRRGLSRLQELIASVRPSLVIAAGNYALWALTNCTKHTSKYESRGVRVPSGIEAWRGSMWFADALPGELGSIPLLPIIHPAAIQREWYKRAITVHDLSFRVPKGLRGDWRPNPPPTLLAPPSFKETLDVLDTWLSSLEEGRAPLRLVSDIETCRGLITCLGFAASKDFAISIPLVTIRGATFESYWSLDEEVEIMRRVRALLSHDRILVEGQNYLYDTQYLVAQAGVIPRLDLDTLLAQHLVFPGTPKDLNYLSSLYCDYHWYWKEDGKEWDTKGDITSHLRYNALDCVRQFEVGTTLRRLLSDLNLLPLWEEQRRFYWLAFRMMRRGVRIDRALRARLAFELQMLAKQTGDWLLKIVPQEEVNPKAKTPWFRSATQCRDFFSRDLGLDLPLHRKTKNPTFGKEALSLLTERHPEFSRLFSTIRDYRSIEVFRRTFVDAPLDFDGRMRCSFNPGGTETFRWSSSENVFGSGTNLQNIPEGTEE